MIIAVVAHMWSELTAAILVRNGGDVKTFPLTAELARQLHLAHQLNLDQPGAETN